MLVSIPGTEQAKEAVIANQIPQTATVKRSQAKLTVTYDGAPQFRPIEGTSMEYAINTSSEVIHAAGRYYAVQNGVWFVSDVPTGPWAVADNIPAEIYSIPPSNPLYHDRYVYVYGSTPDKSTSAITPGYLGAYVWDDTVVFGTGWWYPGWIGGYWYGWPWTWGFGFELAISAEAGSGVPTGSGGITTLPSWGGFITSTGIRIGLPATRKDPATTSMSIIAGAATPLQPGPSGLRPSALGPAISGAAGRDLYAGKDGNVYEHQGNNDPYGTHQHRGKRIQPPSDVRQAQQSRSFGESRMSDFGRSGFSQGFPRSMPSFGGGGGFHGGGGGGRR